MLVLASDPLDVRDVRLALSCSVEIRNGTKAAIMWQPKNGSLGGSIVAFPID